MKVTNVEKKENSTVELTIHVEADEFEAAVQKAYLKSRSRIAVPGFRKGKAPRKIIEGIDVYKRQVQRCSLRSWLTSP